VRSKGSPAHSEDLQSSMNFAVVCLCWSLPNPWYPCNPWFSPLFPTFVSISVHSPGTPAVRQLPDEGGWLKDF
jgi:hypothetical protein